MTPAASAKNEICDPAKQQNSVHSVNVLLLLLLPPGLNCHLRSHSQQSPEQEEVDFQLSEDIRQLPNVS